MVLRVFWNFFAFTICNGVWELAGAVKSGSNTSEAAQPDLASTSVRYTIRNGGPVPSHMPLHIDSLFLLPISTQALTTASMTSRLPPMRPKRSDEKEQNAASNGGPSSLEAATPPDFRGDVIAVQQENLSFWTRIGCTPESFKKRTSVPGQNALNQTMKPRHLHMIAIGGSIGAGFFVGSGSALYRGVSWSTLSRHRLRRAKRLKTLFERNIDNGSGTWNAPC